MSYDVLVLGGGGAGLCAAIAARGQGARVLLASKVRPGLGNCTAYANGFFSLGVEGMSPEEHRRSTYETGRFLNQPDLLDVLAAEAPARVPGLRDYGVKIDLRRGGASVARYSDRPLMAGSALTLPLVAHARETGVETRERVFANRLLMGEGSVEAVELVNLESGEIEAVAARAVVVATGGGGQIYGRTDNPVRTTGDGYCLLYEAGAELVDMEFVQFYPLGFDQEGYPKTFIDLHVIDRMSLTNRHGEKFLNRLLPSWGLKSGNDANIYARDRSAIAIAKEARSAGPIHLHLEELGREGWDKPVMAKLRQLCRVTSGGANAPVRVSPIQHYFSGGARITADGSTDLSGVYACGEVAGGVDGASRVGGNALSSIAVFGGRAGRAAAEYALSRPGGAEGSKSGPSTRRSPIEGECPAPGLSPVRDSGTAGGVRGEAGEWTPASLRRRINRISDSYLGPLRDGAGLEKALREFEAVAAAVSRQRVAGRGELLEALEVESLLITARLVARAALARTESRGVHYRDDFPEENPAWLKQVILRREGDSTKVVLVHRESHA